MILDKDTKLLLSFLRDVLWHSEKAFPSELSENESQRLLALANKQAVTGLVGDTLILNDVRMPKQCVFEAVGTLEQIKQQSRKVTEGVVRLHQLILECGIWYAVMKGQALALYYPDASLRQSGNIDYYCRPNFLLE